MLIKYLLLLDESISKIGTLGAIDIIVQSLFDHIRAPPVCFFGLNVLKNVTYKNGT